METKQLQVAVINHPRIFASLIELCVITLGGALAPRTKVRSM